MEEYFSNLFDTRSWPPRWTSGKWSDFHGWMYILSDIAIWAAYFTISGIMLSFLFKRKDKIPFLKVFWLFTLFILLCGLSHLMDAMMFWYPAYKLNGLVLFLTAVISWAAALHVFRILPDAIQLKSPAQLQKIIDLRTTELEHSNKNLIKLNKEIDNYIYAATHDLKSPINNIEGLVAILKKPGSESYSDEIFARIETSILGVKKAINNLTEAIKLERSPLDDIQEVDIAEIVDEVLKENDKLFQASKCEMVLDIQVPILKYSRTVLKSTLYNLLTNAAKYHSDERLPVIKVSLLRESGHVVLRISDNGIGMDLNLYGEKLFGLFKRFHSHVEGSGLGLYMVKKMIEDKGGKIEVKSEPAKGAEFTVTLE